MYFLINRDDIYLVDRINLKLKLMFAADTIFHYKNGQTIYYKDRHNLHYQYTPDEIVMMKLRATPI